MKTIRMNCHTDRKRILLTFALGLLLALFLCRPSFAQEESRSTERIYTFNERGDASVEFNFGFDRTSWDMWKAQYGDHPDVLLRFLKHDLAAAVIDDFALEKDDTHRKATARFKAKALANYRGNNQFEIPVAKSTKLVTGSGLEWVFMESGNETTPKGENRIVNITYRAKLPAKAQNAHLVNGNDQNRLAYTLEVTPAKPKTLLYGGVALVAAAVVLGLVSGRAGGATRVYPSLPPSNERPPGALPRS
jgi:hypothetical protein